MRSLKLNIIFSCLLLIGSCPLFAQVKFTAKFTPNTIGTEETAELKLLVENAGNVQNITPPSLKDFIVVSGPNQESGMESINGVTRQYTGITYIVKPKYKGSFVVPSTTAMADGKAFTSNPVKLTVVPGTTGNSISSNSPFAGIMSFDEPVQRGAFNDYILKKGENVADKINKNIFVKVDATKTSCYVGEPILVTYKLYTRLKSESNIVKNPSFNGFSVIDMMRSINAYSLVEQLNGRDYNVYTLRKAQLYPLQAGDVTLETASVENDIHFIKEEYLRNNNNGFFNDPSLMPIPADAMVDEKVTLQSKPLVINVKPLPEQGKPADFNGAVGDFKITTAVERDSISTDDAGKLKLVIEGQGNLNLVNAPELSWPNGMQAYEPSMQEDIDRQSAPLSGSKQFVFDFTVDAAGVYTLPAAAFSYFDPASAQYKTVTAAPITIKVSKGTGKRPAIQAKQPVKSTKESFFETIFTKRWILVVALIALLLIGLIVYLRIEKKHKQAAQVKQIKQKEEEVARPLVKEGSVPLVLSKALLQTDDAPAFYATLDRELKNFLAKKLNLQSGTLNKRMISDALMEKNISAEDSEAVLNLLDEISMQLYTPVADESRMSYFFKKAEAVVHLLNAV